jgi:3-hydroxyacyl-[acyl-carrier-protein] dehydratase
MELNLEDIKKILPHREPFLFIDKVVELEKGKKVVAIKNITGKEDYFKGHFPGKPIMPGVLIAEAMAQAAVVLADSVFPKEKNKRYIYYLGRANIRFSSLNEGYSNSSEINIRVGHCKDRSLC